MSLRKHYSSSFFLIEQFSFKIFSYLAASKMKPCTTEANESHDSTGNTKSTVPRFPQPITSV